ncbi:MAG TPA: hypothetical protein VHR86_04995, partial [Armatimonadota bacterium]|nr:hypothetical protein [Armatimonadota bacterium]
MVVTESDIPTGSFSLVTGIALYHQIADGVPSTVKLHRLQRYDTVWVQGYIAPSPALIYQNSGCLQHRFSNAGMEAEFIANFRIFRRWGQLRPSDSHSNLHRF